MAAILLFLLTLVVRPASAPASQAAAEQREPAPFSVGVLRRDGIVSPFAAFDGKNWTMPWPGDLHSTDLPIDLHSIPAKWWGKTGAVDQMTAWVDGVNRGPIHITRYTVLPLMCEARASLVSDYRSSNSEPPSLEPPFPKDGLAVTGAQPVERIEILSSASPEWAPVAAFLAPEFDRAENAAIEGFMGWKHPVPRAARRKMPVELEALYRAPMDEPGWTAYYIEAVKRYPPGPEDEGCGLITSASGWLATAPDGKKAGRLAAQVTYCDRRDVTYMLPLGVLPVQGRRYWAFQLSGYGREGYAIVRLTPKRLESEVKYSAGVCARRIGGLAEITGR